MGRTALPSTGHPASGQSAPSYAIARHEGAGLEVLCVLPASGEGTLPVFASRKTALRYLRCSSFRFGLVGSGWRVKKFSGGELTSLLFAFRASVRRVVLDPSPEDLVGDCVATPLTNVTGPTP